VISVLLLIITVFCAYVIVIVGGAAYEVTGLDRETAHFQALSAFTGTGFTTRMSERVVNTPARRRITIVLIILGYAGTATVVASLVTSVDAGSTVDSLRNIVALLVSGAATWGILSWFGTMDWMLDAARKVLPRSLSEPVVHEDLLYLRSGFGIVRVEIPPDSPLIGLKLRETNLRERMLQVLAIDVNHHVQPVPDPDWVFVEGAVVVVYGELDKVDEAFIGTRR
jgi:hypothetical protein